MTSKLMNRKFLIAWLTLPIGLFSLLPKPALADEHHNEQTNRSISVETAKPYGDHGNQIQPNHNYPNRDRRDFENRRGNELRNEARQQEIRRQQERQEQLRRNELRHNERQVWVPGHNESGFLGLFSHWIEGHWEDRR